MNLIHDDCLNYMAKMRDNSIDLTVTSPPYDNLRTYKNSLEWGDHVWMPVFKNLYRVTKDGGVVVWVVGDATIKGSETGTSFKQALYAIQCGFNLHDTMIWEKAAPIPQFKSNRYTSSFEYVFIFSKGRVQCFNPLTQACKTAGAPRIRVKHSNNWRSGVKNDEVRIKPTQDTKKLTNVWKVASVSSKTGHPATFPESLALDHILSWSNEGAVVFDPFMGSGTTGKMATISGRQFIGVEKVKEYFEMSKTRISSVTELLI